MVTTILFGRRFIQPRRSARTSKAVKCARLRPSSHANDLRETDAVASPFVAGRDDPTSFSRRGYPPKWFMNASTTG